MELKESFDLSAIIAIVFFLGIVVSFLSYQLFQLRLSAAITLGVIISYLFLNIMYPIGILMYERRPFVITIYIIIECVVPIYLFFYLLIQIMNSHRETEFIIPVDIKN